MIPAVFLLVCCHWSPFDTKKVPLMWPNSFLVYILWDALFGLIYLGTLSSTWYSLIWFFFSILILTGASRLWFKFQRWSYWHIERICPCFWKFLQVYYYNRQQNGCTGNLTIWLDTGYCSFSSFPKCQEALVTSDIPGNFEVFAGWEVEILLCTFASYWRLKYI